MTDNIYSIIDAQQIERDINRITSFCENRIVKTLFENKIGLKIIHKVAGLWIAYRSKGWFKK